MRRQLLRALWVVTTLLASRALADGAFPDSFAIFAPPDQPGALFLSTNFGLAISQDYGQTWNISCEISMLAPNATIYQLGPPPNHPIFALSYLNGLSYSADEGCSWALVDGGVPAKALLDAFPDPTDATHVLAVGRIALSDGGFLPESIYESRTGGASFSMSPLYAAQSAHFITGIEVARTQPNTYYATVYANQNPLQPLLLRSDDNGSTWSTFDLSASLGPTSPRLAAVDPTDPQRVYLRLIDAQGHEGLGLVTDGGATAATLFALPTTPVPAQMSAFLRRADGTLFIGQRSANGAWVSTNGGASFQPAFPNCQVEGLADSDAGVYLATNNLTTGFAVGLSAQPLTDDCTPDGGVRRLLQYQGICGPRQCGSIPCACANWWANQQGILATPPNVCGPPPVNNCPQPDAGPSSGSDAGTSPTPPHACGCAPTPAFLGPLALLLLAALAARRRVA